ncbi:hypothetical protein TgHK011_001090 [Trichoderma gracile]|nr:hypothetical protein TgHK011_001090 [Trichoderma gracile]
MLSVHDHRSPSVARWTVARGRETDSHWKNLDEPEPRPRQTADGREALESPDTRVKQHLELEAMPGSGRSPARELPASSIEFSWVRYIFSPIFNP